MLTVIVDLSHNLLHILEIPHQARNDESNEIYTNLLIPKIIAD